MTDPSDNPIYDSPWAYELACAFRDVSGEVDALLGWCRRRPRSVLELAAGPAEHAREFARRGVAATALDLSPAMCAYAAQRAKAEGVALEVVHGDMTRFSLGRRFDLIITMLDSTAHLMTLDAFVAHLDRAAEHLSPNGRYVLEMSHPRDRLTDESSTGNAWSVEHEGMRADVRWGEPDDRLDPLTQIVREHVTITVGNEVIRGVVPYRFWTATELEAAVRLSGGLEMARRYGDFSALGPDDPGAWRLITLFRPAGQGVGAQPGIG